jgi:hypothetical protein
MIRMFRKSVTAAIFVTLALSPVSAQPMSGDAYAFARRNIDSFRLGQQYQDYVYRNLGERPDICDDTLTNNFNWAMKSYNQTMTTLKENYGDHPYSREIGAYVIRQMEDMNRRVIDEGPC